MTPEERMNQRMGPPAPESPPNEREAVDRAVAKMIDNMGHGPLGDPEFYTKDIPTAAKNVAANTLGLLGDIQSLLPGGTSLFRGRTSEEIAEAIGGDPTHPSWLPSAFLAPGPAEVAAGGKALFIGAFGAKNLGGKAAANLDKFKAMKADVLDPKAYKETGWFNWFDKKPRFHISDADTFIDEGKLVSKIKSSKIRVRNVGTIDMKIGEFFPHEEAFKAYPRLKDVPVTFHIRRLDEDSYEIFNAQKKTLGIKAQLKTSQLGPEIHLYNLEDTVEIKKAMLHEIEHTIQNIENFAGGANSAAFSQILFDAKRATVDKQVIEDLLSNKIDSSDILAGSIYEYSDELAKKFNISNFEAEGIVYEVMQYPDLDEALSTVKQLEEIGVRDTALLLEELGGDSTKIKDFISKMSAGAVRRLAASRYRRSSGEVEARLQERLAEIRQGEIDMRPSLVEEIPRPVKPEQVIK